MTQPELFDRVAYVDNRASARRPVRAGERRPRPTRSSPQAPSSAKPSSSTQSSTHPSTLPPALALKALEDRLRRALGTKVRVTAAGAGGDVSGTLVVQWSSLEHLDELLEKLGA